LTVIHQAIHPAYLAQVLTDRGASAPSVDKIQAYLDSLSSGESEEAKVTLRRIALGVEDSQDLAKLLDAIRAAEPQAAHASGKVSREHQVPPARNAAGSSETADPELRSLLRSHGVHVYGTKAALKIELTTVKIEDAAAPREFTLQVEGALRRGAAHGFDWTRKVSFQLMRRELPLMAAFVLGLAGRHLELKFHGQAADKFLRLEDQGRHLYVQLGHGAQPQIRVPVEPAEMFAWGELCLVCLRLNRPTLGDASVMALLRRVGAMEALCRSERN